MSMSRPISLPDWLAKYPALGEIIEKLDSQLGTLVISPREAEIVFLRASFLNGCARCVRRHERVAVSQGVTTSELEQILDPDVDVHHFSPREGAIVSFVDLLTVNPRDVSYRSTLNLAEHLTRPEISDVVGIISLAAALNRLIHMSAFIG